MSPTIHSSAFKFSSAHKNLSQNNSGSGTNFNDNSKNSASKLSNPLKQQLNHKAQLDSVASDAVRGKGRISSGTGHLKSVTSETPQQSDTRDVETDLSGRPAFPAATASVLQPRAVTHFPQQGAERNSAGHSQKVSNGETMKTLSIDDNVSKDMTKTLSTSDADSLLAYRGNSKNKFAEQSFLDEPCLYSHRMFTRAAKIFEFLKQDDVENKELDVAGKEQDHEAAESGDIPEIDFESPQEQMKTFELTFATLKFQKLFRAILEHTGFFNDFPSFLDNYSLVCIILFDLQSRKFQKRKPFPNEQVDELCCEIEDALLSKKTRLLSHVAKERIKYNAPSIEHLLPEQVRNQDEIKTKTPVYLWVNQMKTTLEDTIAELEVENFTRLPPGEDITEQTGQVFQVDTHCSDLLTFPPHLDMYFKDTNWVKTGHLVQQDKSSCLAPQSVQYLLGIDQDVIHVNVGTGITTAHLASLLRNKSPHSHIWGFGVDTPDKARKATKNLEFLGVKNTKILMENFLNIDPDEPKLKSVRVIMITANCSKSAITSPVQFIVSEGEDMRFLGELTKSDQDLTTVASLTLEHEKILRHALKFPRVQAVVYSTRSRHEAENETVITRVLEYTNSSSNYRGVPFRVTPPVLPFASDEIDSGSSGVDGRFIRFLPSDKSNGCFVAVLAREPEDPKDVARSAIARAKSKGFLGKAKSATQTSENGEFDNQDMGTADLKRSKGGNRKLKGMSVKHSGHKSPTAISTRLYKAGLAQKMDQQAKETTPKSEHLKIVKHPAPFR